MIKFTGELQGGGKFIGFGLSRQNCEKLLDHQPILIDLQKDLNIPFKGRIVILADEDEAALTRSLRDFITEDTKVHPVMTVEEHLTDPRPAKPPEPHTMAVNAARHAEHGPVVLLDFGTPMTKIAIPPSGARALAAALLSEADAAEKIPPPPPKDPS